MATQSESISNAFRRFYFGAVINDIRKNMTEPLRWNGYIFDLRRLSKDSVHKILKILAHFPVNAKLEPKSLTEVTSKELTEYLERVRFLVGQSGYTLTVDVEEWERTIKGMT